MARILKPQKIETITDRATGESVDLMLDRNSKQFFAEFMDERFRHAEAAKVESWIRKQLSDSIKVDWTPVLMVSVRHDNTNEIRSRGVTDFYDNRSLLDIKVNRRYVGITKDGKLKQAEWRGRLWIDGESEDRARIRYMTHCHTKYQVESGKILLPFEETESGPSFDRDADYRTIHLPYLESTWIGLRNIQDGLRRLSDQLEAIIGSVEGQMMISATGERLISAMLPSGEEKPAPEPVDQPVVKHKIEHVSFRLDPDFLSDMGIIIEKDRRIDSAIDGEVVE